MKDDLRAVSGILTGSGSIVLGNFASLLIEKTYIQFII
jgi:hypothetical protein